MNVDKLNAAYKETQEMFVREKMSFRECLAVIIMLSLTTEMIVAREYRGEISREFTEWLKHCKALLAWLGGGVEFMGMEVGEEEGEVN